MRQEAQLCKYADEVAAGPQSFVGKRISVGGYLKTHSKNVLDHEFVIETHPPRRRATLNARYHGLVPDTFKVGGELVATGKLAPDGTLLTDQILAKCPSRY
jgi:cytochrome c-type biogenesis protein CcmE